MVRSKVPPVRVIVAFIVFVIAVLLLMQARLTQAQPQTGSLKTIATIVVHAHHHQTRAAQ